MLRTRSSGTRRRAAFALAAGAALLLPASAASLGSRGGPRGEIAFTIARADAFGTASVRADGTGRHPLGLPQPTILQRPAFSPDGRRVAYVCGNFQLCVASADGRRRARVTRTEPWVFDGGPAWAPDGERLAFSSNRSGRYRIFVVGADGRGLRVVTRGRGDDENPAWAPDGRSIAFDSKAHGSFRLFVVDVRSGARRAVGPRRGGATNPAWSPDGRWLAFTHKLRGGSHVEIVRIDGRRRRVLTRGPWRDDHASWSPDGRWIAFDSNRRGGLHIWRIPSAGGRPTSVTTGASRDLFPVWKPRPRSGDAGAWPRAGAPAAATGDARLVAAFVRRLLAIGPDFSLIKSDAVFAAASIERDAAAAEAELQRLSPSTARGGRFEQAALRAVRTAKTAGHELTLGIEAYRRRDKESGAQHLRRAFMLSRELGSRVEQAETIAGLLI